MTTVVLPYAVMSGQRERGDRGMASPSRNERPFTSFLIKDILNKNTSAGSNGDHPFGIPSIEFLKHKLCPVVPARVADSMWVAGEGLLLARPRPVNRSAVAAATIAFINEAKKGGDKAAAAALLGKDSPDAPLTALEQLTTKTFTGLETSILKAAEAAASGGKRDSLHLLSRQAPRKKRKSRTAFTNHQIFELERRFLYQKYLTPADRDELASTLGLTNAQVITWFQNRRAKLKRDIDELKADLSTKDEEEAEMRSLGAAMKRKAVAEKQQQVKIKMEKLHHLTQDMRSAHLPPPLVATEDTKKRLEHLEPADIIRDIRVGGPGVGDAIDARRSDRGPLCGDYGSSSDENELMESESDADGEYAHTASEYTRDNGDIDRVSKYEEEEHIDVENVVGADRHFIVKSDIEEHRRYHAASPTRSKSC